MSPQGSRILIIDDERITRVPVAFLLKKHGYKVEEAGDGPSGLRAAHGFHPDLILLDISMPHMDGLEVCRKLKEDPETRSIAVVMLSALADRKTVVAAVQAGAKDYLVKANFDIQDLLNRIEKLLGGTVDTAATTRRMPSTPSARRCA